jgi:hypothetical protein
MTTGTEPQAVKDMTARIFLPRVTDVRTRVSAASLLVVARYRADGAIFLEFPYSPKILNPLFEICPRDTLIRWTDLNS